jgi:predicted ATPase/Tfp pilus assembly protein PilF
MKDALVRHDAMLTAGIKQHDGVVVKGRGEGDSFFAVFARASDAVASACSLQRALHCQSWPATTAIRVRMALHTGEADLRDGDYYGTVVNRCARLRAIAHGGQTLLSLTTAELVRSALPEGMSLRALGPHRLKDLQRPEQVFQLVHPDLPWEFPPLRSLDTLRHNLPVQLTNFIGRELEVTVVKGLLSQIRLLTLTGPGGCGKTRLSLQAAAELLEECPDGVWLVELASLTDPAGVPRAVATALGVREEPGQPLPVTLQEHLQHRKLLLVLDNCEHLVEACAPLVDTLLRTCSGLRILATSREALSLAGERVWPVPPLSFPDLQGLPSVESLTQYDAIRLFVDRALLVQPWFALTRQNSPAAARICHRLDGIPLAIEMAAGRVKVLSVEQIDQRLDHRFRLLTSGSRVALPRHSTLRAAIDWSYELLSAPERLLFDRLSVFAGGFTLEAAEEVCSGRPVETAEVLELLSHLVEKSLVGVEESPEGKVRYRLLETLRQYGEEHLEDSGEMQATKGQHLTFFLTLAEQAEPELTGPDQVAWLASLDKEHDNLRAALNWAQKSGEVESELRLAGALWRFWLVRGFFGEGRQHLEGALSRSNAAPAPLRAKVLSGGAGLAWYQADFSRATLLLEEELALRQELAERKGIANVLNHLGLVAYSQGDYKRAAALQEESLATWRELGDKRAMGYCLNNLGVVAREQGNYDRAGVLFEESAVLCRELPDKHLIARVLNNLGYVASRQRDHDRAEALCEEGLALARSLEDKDNIAFSLYTLGYVAQHEEDYTQATRLFLESLALYQQLGDKLGIAECLEGLAGVASLQALLEQGARLLGAAEALRAAIGAPLPPASRGEYERAIATVRVGLGREAFAGALAQGRAMNLQQAVMYAMGLQVHT